MRRLTKASIESLVDSCVELMRERDTTREDANVELLFEVDTLDDLYTVLGYFLETYGSNIKTGDTNLIEQWDFQEGTTYTAQFKMFNDFWVSIAFSNFWDEGLCEMMDGCMIIDLRAISCAEVIE